MNEPQEQPEPIEPTQEYIDDLLEQAKHVYAMSMANLRTLAEKMLAVLFWASKSDPSLKGKYTRLQGAVSKASRALSLIFAIKEIEGLVISHREKQPKPKPSPAPKKPRPDTDSGLPRPGDD